MKSNSECLNISNSYKHQKTSNVSKLALDGVDSKSLEILSLLQGPQSPDVSREALNAFEMSRMAIWNMYQNASPPNQLHTTSPPEVQREALNLQRESPSPIPVQSPIMSIKRERDQSDISDYHVPPAKRGLVRTNSDLNRKTSLNNNNNHHHISNNNNSHVTPTKVTAKSMLRPESPNVENGNHHRSPPTHHKQQQNGMDNLGTTMLNGMQFKIISKGKIPNRFDRRLITTIISISPQKIHQPANRSWWWSLRWTVSLSKASSSRIPARPRQHLPHRSPHPTRLPSRWCRRRRTSPRRRSTTTTKCRIRR